MTTGLETLDATVIEIDGNNDGPASIYSTEVEELATTSRNICSLSSLPVPRARERDTQTSDEHSRRQQKWVFCWLNNRIS